MRCNLAMNSELRSVLLGVLLMLLINVITSSRSPTIWIDEGMFTDPAARAVAGRGFTSTAWAGFAENEFWAGNAPLHSMFLVPWVGLFGLSPTAVRAIGSLYVAIGTMALWWALRRWTIGTTLSRTIIVAIVLCEPAVSFSYRSGRYDALGMMLGGVAAAVVAGHWRYSWAGLVTIGTAVPWTGLHLLPFVGVVCLAALGVFGARRASPFVLCIGIGVLLGGSLLVGLWYWMGVLDQAVRSIQGFRGASDPALAAHWIASVTAALATAISDRALIVLVSIIAIGFLIQRYLVGRHEVFLGTIVAAAPLAVGASGRFPIYYTWMAVIPACVVAVPSLRRLFVAHAPKWLTWPLALALVFGVSSGLPASTTLSD